MLAGSSRAEALLLLRGKSGTENADGVPTPGDSSDSCEQPEAERPCTRACTWRRPPCRVLVGPPTLLPRVGFVEAADVTSSSSITPGERQISSSLRVRVTPRTLFDVRQHHHLNHHTRLHLAHECAVHNAAVVAAPSGAAETWKKIGRAGGRGKGEGHNRRRNKEKCAPHNNKSQRMRDGRMGGREGDGRWDVNTSKHTRKEKKI